MPGQTLDSRLLPLYTANRPEVHEIVAEMRDVIDALFGSRPHRRDLSPNRTARHLLRPDLNGAQLPFNFQLIQAAWNAESIARIVDEYEAALPHGAWPNWVLGNHDQPRIGSRIGTAQARVAAMLLLTLRGTPTLYYGDELGMTDVPIPPDQVQDPVEKKQPGLGLGRDPERTPMPWDATSLAGFTSGTPWLPLGNDHATANVAALSGCRDSILNLYRRLIAFRREHPALTSGAISAVGVESHILHYERQDGKEHLAIFLNLSHEHQPLSYRGRLLLSTYAGDPGADTGDGKYLRPDEAIIVEVPPS